MKKSDTYYFIFLCIALIFLFILSMTDSFLKESSQPIYNISMIVNNSDDTNWRIFKDGAEKASYENNIDLNFLTLYDENNTTQQIQIIKSETLNGADCIIVAPSNSESIVEALYLENTKIPVIFINNNISNEIIKDNAVYEDEELVEQFLEKMKNENENKKAIIFWKNKVAQNYNERLEFIKNYFEKNNLPLEEVYYVSESHLKGLIANNNINSENHYVICLNENDLVNIGDYYSKSEEKDINIYGFGFNQKIINYLESKIIKSIIAPDYYSLGYISIIKGKYAIENKYKYDFSEKEIKVMIIDNEEIFSPENQLFLFPIE